MVYRLWVGVMFVGKCYGNTLVWVVLPTFLAIYLVVLWLGNIGNTSTQVL